MKPHEPGRYDGLLGDAFLDAVFVARDLPMIEGLWRANDAALAVRLAPRLVALNEPAITSLLLDEILDGSDSEPLAAAVTADLVAASPALSGDALERLVTRLNDATPLSTRYEQRRTVLARWAMSQPGSAVDLFARAVIRAEVMSGDVSVREAAYTRARGSKRLAAAMAGDLEAQLLASADATTWARAVDFVQAVLADVRPASLNVGRLVSALVRLAPTYQGKPVFGSPLADLAVTDALPAVEEMLGGAPLSGHAGSAIADLVDRVPDPTDRGRLFLLAMARQPQHYPTPDRLNTWTIEDWTLRLDTLLASPDGPPAGVATLMARAPQELAGRVVDLGKKYGEGGDVSLLPTVVAKIKERIAQVDPSDPSGLAAAYWWPASPEDADGLAYLRSLLDGLGDPTGRVAAVAAGVATGRLAPELAPKLLNDGQSAELLHRPEMTGGLVRQVTPLLYDERRDEVVNAIRSDQARAFSLDLAAGIASRDPRAAFEGAVAAYDHLDDDGKEELLSLLEAHGTRDQEPVVARYASESQPLARSRRVRAITLVGRLLPKGGTVPEYLSAALSVSYRPIQNAVLEAVGVAEPRDASMARRLREIAVGDGAASGGARRALDALTGAYLADLAQPIDHARRIETLTLLGATARHESVPALLGHVGENTPDDEPEVHRAAAEALAEAASHLKFSSENVDQLGRLIDEEGDTAARQSLNTALARAVLGEDEAIRVLYTLIGRPPQGQHSADDLFGPERAMLVRALTLYHNDSRQGERGWPGAIQQLDIAAERLARAAYRFVGTSPSIKAEIASDPRKPDYGNILGHLQGKLDKAQGPLKALHQLRSEETEYSHPGRRPTEATMTAAQENFRMGALVLVGVLEQNA